MVICRQVAEPGRTADAGRAKLFQPAAIARRVASARPARGRVRAVTVAASHAHDDARTATRWRAAPVAWSRRVARPAAGEEAGKRSRARRTGAPSTVSSRAREKFAAGAAVST